MGNWADAIICAIGSLVVLLAAMVDPWVSVVVSSVVLMGLGAVQLARRA